MVEEHALVIEQSIPLVLPFGLRIDPASLDDAIGQYHMIRLVSGDRLIPIGPGLITRAELDEYEGVPILRLLVEAGPDLAHDALQAIRDAIGDDT